MANESSAVRSGGISFSGALTVLFIGLKLTGFIHWSWLWVLAPLWIGLALFIVIFLVIAIVAIIVAILA